MKLGKIVLSIVLLTCMNSIYADEVGAWTTVKYIYTPVGSNQPFIQFGAASMPGCYGNYGAYLPVGIESGANRSYSTILAAFMAQKEVRIYYKFREVASGYNGWGLCEITNIYALTKPSKIALSALDSQQVARHLRRR